MKKLKLLVVATMMVGLWSGSASAILIDAEFNITGDQTDGYGSSRSVSSGNPNVFVQDWIGINVAAVLPQGNMIDFTASGGQTSIATPSFNLRLWNAIEVAGNWSTVGAALITQIPAGNFTPMIGSLMAGGTYLMEFFGTVEFANCPPALACGDPQTGLYSMSMTSGNVPPPAVPVPAAVWLFGTALVGFIGMSRRRKVA